MRARALARVPALSTPRRDQRVRGRAGEVPRLAAGEIRALLRRARAGASARLGSRAVARYLHTMVRITDPAPSRAFYEALGFRFSSEMDIVRSGELEATNYFFSIGVQENVLELTYNHDGRTYYMGTAYGHITVG